MCCLKKCRCMERHIHCHTKPRVTKITHNHTQCFIFNNEMFLPVTLRQIPVDRSISFLSALKTVMFDRGWAGSASE